MTKFLGYIISLIGLVVLSLPFIIPSLLGSIPKYYIIIAGIIIIFFGLFGLGGKKKGKTKQASEEVPIYQGEGKHKRIVGYKKA